MAFSDPVRDREYQRKYQPAYQAARYRAIADRCLAHLGGRCVQCGSTHELEIDHVDRSTKSFTIMSEWKKPWNDLVQEMTKCQLLCKPHHLDKTIAEAPRATRLHGTYRKYLVENCRCSDCCEAYSAARRQWRKPKLRQ